VTPVRTPTETPSPPPLVSPTVTAHVKRLNGDVDCDGRVDALDALSLLRGLANVPATGCATPMDATCSMDTVVLEALQILRFSAGLALPETTGCQLAS
jgi:hypothetical protein